MKNIGIRGHRGAGKESVAYLLACTLDFLSTDNKQQFDSLYIEAVRKLVDDKNKAFSEANFRNIYLDAFGDAPRAMVQQLLGCEFKYIWDEYWKDHAVVNLKTFDIEEVNELPAGLKTPDDLPLTISVYQDDIKMSLRNFILYFGINVMQKHFGRDVWVKSTAQNDKLNESYIDNSPDYFRIYTDIKAPTELTYLIDRQAVIINVERKEFKKEGGLDLLRDDARWDYNIQIMGNDLMSIKEDIWRIANLII